MSAAKKRINVAYSLDKAVPRTLEGDAGRLQQVLLNSLVNSLKFTPDGGHVSIQCSSKQDADGIVRLHIKVADTGIGISGEGLPKLFACFSQVDNENMTNRKYDGAGLGLAISRRLCEAMGGTMTAESDGPGLGSTFHISILLKELPPGAIPRMSPGRHMPNNTFLAGRRLLIVDSCEPVRVALARWVIESWGAREVAAVDGEQALEPALLHGGTFDAIFAEATTPILLAIKAHLQATRAPSLRVFAMMWPVIPASYAAPGLGRPSSFSGLEQGLMDDAPLDPATFCPEDVLPGCISMPKPLRQSRIYAALVAAFSPDAQHSAQPLKDSVSAASLDKAECAPPTTKALPAAQKQVAGVPVDTAAGRMTAALRVLLAEDHAINQKVVISLLTRYGHRVTCVAHDGVDALEKLRETAGGPAAFDVILMDLHMPRMGGLECASVIASEWPHCQTPIIAVTADAFEESRQRCLSGGFAGWLSKPFRVDGMLSVLSEVTGTVAARLQTASGPEGEKQEQLHSVTDGMDVL